MNIWITKTPAQIDDASEHYPAQEEPDRHRPGRPGHRVRRRDGHLRRHGPGRPAGRPRRSPLVHHRRRHLRLLRPDLFRARLHVPGRGQHVFLLLCRLRRGHRLDHRLGPHARIPGRRERRRLGLVDDVHRAHPERRRQAAEGPPDPAHHDQRRRQDRPVRRHRRRPGHRHHPAHHLDPLHRHQGERQDQQHHRPASRSPSSSSSSSSAPATSAWPTSSP